MADTVIIPKADYVALLDAIREKGGTSALMTTPQATAAVEAIETGITPTGTKQISITENGTTTEDVAAYANAEITVDVQGGGGVPVIGLIDTIQVENGVSLITYDLPELALSYGAIWVQLVDVVHTDDYLYLAVLPPSQKPTDLTGYVSKASSHSGIYNLPFCNAAYVDGLSLNGLSGFSGRFGSSAEYEGISQLVAKLYNANSVFTGGAIRIYGRIA